MDNPIRPQEEPPASIAAVDGAQQATDAPKPTADAALAAGAGVAQSVTDVFHVPAPSIPTQEGPMGVRYDFNDGARVLLPKGQWHVHITDEEADLVLDEPYPQANLPRKFLDTSVIIDGRVLDIVKTGFLEGDIVIPQFVLAELRHIADSGDSLRRARGRRGLDVLNKLQKELKNPIIVDDSDYEDITEVDVKLLRLCRDKGGIVVTNDYNLNKVAGVTGIRVLNINDLANAVKPMLMAGEDLTVQVVREGKEPGQGVAYLDDGTMIVVDNGRRYVGENVAVVVTTVLQTSAGRMIFTKIKPSSDEKAG